MTKSLYTAPATETIAMQNVANLLQQSGTDVLIIDTSDDDYNGVFHAKRFVMSDDENNENDEDQ